MTLYAFVEKYALYVVFYISLSSTHEKHAMLLLKFIFLIDTLLKHYIQNIREM